MRRGVGVVWLETEHYGFLVGERDGDELMVWVGLERGER